jgi:hypothetical protein
VALARQRDKKSGVRLKRKYTILRIKGNIIPERDRDSGVPLHYRRGSRERFRGGVHRPVELLAFGQELYRRRWCAVYP